MKRNNWDVVVLIIAVLAVFVVVLLGRYKINFIRDSGIVARYDRWTGKVTIVQPQ